MQFSDLSTKQGLIEDITFWTGLDINAYPLADRTRNINERYRQVLAVVFGAYGGWKWQDDNSNANPYGEANLVSGTAVYALPTETLRVRMVEILNSGGTYEILTPITEKEFKQLGGDAGFTSNGVPRYYLLYEDQIKLLPAPNYSYTNGLRVFIDRDISSFVATDTTKTPGFASPFHRVLSIGASLDYSYARTLKNEAKLEQMWSTYMADIFTFYTERFHDRFPPKLKPGRDIVNSNT